jgi:CBS domain containing-hemolysin-like protein
MIPIASDALAVNLTLQDPLALPLLGAIVAGEAGGGTWTGLLFFILVALGFSFLCSIWEAVVLSTTHSHIEVEVSKGRPAGKIMRRLKGNIENAISAILTLNTIAHTVGAAGAGAQAVGIFGNEWFGVVSAILTLLILVFSEIIPKTLGAVYWKALMPFTAYGVQLLIWLLFPAVKVFQAMSEWMTPRKKRPTVTRSEIKAFARIGREEGSLNADENRILQNLFQLSEVAVAEVMTPRTVVFVLQADDTVGEVARAHPVLTFSRIPVTSGGADEISAMVLRFDILRAVADDCHETRVSELATPIHSVPASVSVSRVLQQFIDRREHIFRVVDEYGSTAGIVTMEDAIESLLGTEILDESDVVEDMRALARDRRGRRIANLRSRIPRLEAGGEESSQAS